MAWQIVVGICTLLGGLAAAIAVYGFVAKRIRFSQDEAYDAFLNSMEKKLSKNYGTLIIRASKKLLGKEVEIHEERKNSQFVRVDSIHIGLERVKIKGQQRYYPLYVATYEEVISNNYHLLIPSPSSQKKYFKFAPVTIYPGRITEVNWR